MSHVPITDIHRYVGDPFTLRITVEGLTQAQVDLATWKCGTISKAKDDGITVDDQDGVAVLVVTITKADTDTLGVANRAWQAAAGADPPPVVAVGKLNLTKRI